MDLRTLRSIVKFTLTLLTILAISRHAFAQQTIPAPGVSIGGGGRTIPRVRPDTGPKPKTIHGTVQDSNGKAIEGAHVLVRDTKTSVTRTLTTNADMSTPGRAR